MTDEPTDAESETRDEIETLDEDPVQATILSFDSVTVADNDGDTRDAVHVGVETEGDADTTEDDAPTINQGPSLPEANPLHEKAIAACENIDRDIDTRAIEFCQMPTVQTDEYGSAYITDMKGLVRYYLGDWDAEDKIETTDKYDDLKKVADGTQRKTDFEQIVAH